MESRPLDNLQKLAKTVNLSARLSGMARRKTGATRNYKQAWSDYQADKTKENLLRAFRLATTPVMGMTDAHRKSVQAFQERIARVSVMDAWENNTVRALQHDYVKHGGRPPTISGPKVNSFMLNLMGVAHEVTNDTWMAIFAAIDQKLFEGGLNAAGQIDPADPKADPGKGFGYLAFTARVRATAAYLTKLTGESWTPAEVQETIWSWSKVLYEMATEGKSPLDVLESGEITDEKVGEAPDFAQLFKDEPRYTKLLRDAGYGQKITSLTTGRDDGSATGDLGFASGEAGSLAKDIRKGLLAKSARRLGKVKKAREAKAAAKARARSKGETQFSKQVELEEDRAYERAVDQGDMETAARMVAERAEAERFDAVQEYAPGNDTVFHGSPNWAPSKRRHPDRAGFIEIEASNFTTFELEREPAHEWSVSSGLAIHFSTTREEAESYAEIAERDEESFKLDAMARVGEGEVREFYLRGRYWDISRGENNKRVEWTEAERKLIKTSLHGGGNVEVVYADTREFLLKHGFDGIVYARPHWFRDYEFAVFDSANIKSANAATYDDQGNLIPLSKRFDKTSDGRSRSGDGPRQAFGSRPGGRPHSRFGQRQGKGRIRSPGQPGGPRPGDGDFQPGPRGGSRTVRGHEQRPHAGGPRYARPGIGLAGLGQRSPGAIPGPTRLGGRQGRRRGATGEFTFRDGPRVGPRGPGTFGVLFVGPVFPSPPGKEGDREGPTPQDGGHQGGDHRAKGSRERGRPGGGHLGRRPGRRGQAGNEHNGVTQADRVGGS